MSEKFLSLTAMFRILKSAGAERVSNQACRELRIILEEFGLAIGKEALSYMKHANRKTLKLKDIRIARSKKR